MNTNPVPQSLRTVAVALDEPLLTAEQVADLLAIPRSSVYEYARRHNEPLPSIRVGRHRRFYRAEIERWLALCASRS
jgi:excisionase family DNA binding protein